MRLFYQLLGITGVVLTGYGLLALAITQVSSVFFWTLLVLGLLSVGTFIVGGLSRQWQYTVLSFIGLNAPWILMVIFSGSEAFKPLITSLQKGDVDGFSYLVLAMAILGNGLAFYFARLFLKELFENRSLRVGTTAVVYSIIFFAIVVVVNIGSQDIYKEWDFTENQVNTLTDQSRKVLDRLEDTTKIMAFYDDQNQMKPALEQLMRRYKAESDKIDFRFVDPDRENQLALKYSVQDGDIVVEYEGQSNLIREPSEEAVTQAILKVTRTESPKVCFTKGRGELDIDGTDQEPRSLSAIKGGIENEGYEAVGIEDVAGGIEESCKILVVASPQTPFTADEAQAIDQFLTSGGSGYFLLDPMLPNQNLAGGKVEVLPTGLEDVLAKWGANLGKNLLLERHLKLLEGMQTELNVIARKYGNHPVVDPMKGRQTVFQNLRSVSKADGFDGTAIELIFSAEFPNSWAEKDVQTMFTTGQATPDETDIKGPVPLAVASEKDLPGGGGEQKTKLIVMGDGDFIANGVVRAYEFNFDLFLNSLNWLQGDIEQISIRPKKLRTSTIELTPEETNRIFYFAIITLPMLILIFGLNLWWWRRRRG